MKSGIWPFAGVAVLSLAVAAQALAAEPPDLSGQSQGRPPASQGNNAGGGRTPMSHEGPGRPLGNWQQRPAENTGGQWQGHPQGNGNGQWQGHPQWNGNGQWQGHPQGNGNGQWQGRPQGNGNGQWQGGAQWNGRGQWQGNPRGDHDWHDNPPGNNGGQWSGRPPVNNANPGIPPPSGNDQWKGRPIGAGTTQWQGEHSDRPGWQGGSRPPPGGWQGRPPSSHGNWGPHPSYWRPGYVVNSVPAGHYRVPYRGADYYFDDGYWYRPYGSRYVVVTPPYGVRVRYLPSYAEQVWIGSIGYFLVAGTYYLWQASSQDYEVVAPPMEQPLVAQSSYDVIAYPLYGQGQDQQARDRYECHQWAASQSGFDPASASYAPPAYVADNYRRALGACLSGRGYSVN